MYVLLKLLTQNIFVYGPGFNVHLWKYWLLVTLSINLLTIFEWTLIERSILGLLGRLLVKLLIGNIFVEGPGLSLFHSVGYTLA